MGSRSSSVSPVPSKPHWIFRTLLVNIDGTGQEELAVPPEDGVQDWSSDGRWLLTTSQRGAKNGWQLYVMRPDGTDQRRITEGGNPFYARFSPDGRRVVYSDNGRDEQSGIWVVDVDGKNARLVFPVVEPGKTVASACWSPDGKRIAVILAAINLGVRRGPPVPVQVVVMDLDGGHRSEIHIPEGGTTRYAGLAMMPGRGVLGVIPAPLLAPGGRVDRLAVDARRGPGMAGLLRRADLDVRPENRTWLSFFRVCSKAPGRRSSVA